MRVTQNIWTKDNGWHSVEWAADVSAPQIVMYFAAPEAISESKCIDELKKMYPTAHLIGCSTGGEIVEDEVLDESVVVTAIEFEKTKIQMASSNIDRCGDSFACGRHIGRELLAEDLAAIFVLCDGVRANGSELVRGIIETVGKHVPITGGMAGDGDRFNATLVGANCEPTEGQIAAFGLYGDSLVIGHGSEGGWDVFGPEREITRSDGNVLYELDGEPALELYKRYLGEEAQNLPGSALLCPLKVRPRNAPNQDLVRTIVGIDEQANSMIFAGNVPEGHVAQLMRGNFDHLVEGAAGAARAAVLNASNSQKLAVMVSCIGRKLLMGQRIVEEIEAARDEFDGDTVISGFYSYGEISPHAVSGVCDLHNQTMTVTVFSER